MPIVYPQIFLYNKGIYYRKDVGVMAVSLAKPLKDLLLASNLGLNKNHPLAGWNILTILYHDGSNREPITLDYLTQRYNAEYLDSDNDEQPISDNVLKAVLTVLSDQAKLIEAASRKIRARTQNGAYHVRTSYVYRITSSGIEYVKMMQRVLDAESTITANTNRIQEYCDLVVKLSKADISTRDTALFNDFQNMVSAYDDVMNGMHKLDDDLNELANDIAFNHGGAAAKHLQSMVYDKAIPAFNMMLTQGPRIKAMAYGDSFADHVARSQQGSDDLDTASAVQDKAKLLTRFNRTKDYVNRQLAKLALSVDPSTSAIDSSLDSLYLVFQTILEAVQVLSQEYEHVRSQAVDVKALTAQIDQLLTRYQTLTVYTNLPRHLPADRDTEDPEDLLDASTMGPVTYTPTVTTREVATAADNPKIAEDHYQDTAEQAALAEFQQLVMQTADHGVVDADLNFETTAARDEVLRLYAATGYSSYASFAPFGRPVRQVTALTDTGPIALHCQNETFKAILPSGFTIDFV